MTVERPLRLKGIDPERAYSPKEIKALKVTSERSDDASPVIKKIHKKCAAADPLSGLFPTTIDGKLAVVEYEPDPDLRDSEQVPLLEEGGIEAVELSAGGRRVGSPARVETQRIFFKKAAGALLNPWVRDHRSLAVPSVSSSSTTMRPTREKMRFA